MSTMPPPQSPWQQCAQDMAACSLTLIRAILPDQETLQTLHSACLRAQAEILKGLLSVVEARLTKMAASPPTAGEKIPVD